jgi:RNA polymerase sigma-70 factor (ECF subfamily)
MVPRQTAGGRRWDARVQAQHDFDQQTDQELIAAINGGEPAAFDALYFRYRDWVVQRAFNFTGDESAALDVLQETFLYVLKKFPGFQLTAQFKTFLYPAVRNLSIAARRKSDRYQATDSELRELDAKAAPEPNASDTAELDYVLDSLPEPQREVLQLRFVDDLSLNEIAQALEIPLGTVKSRLHNALQTLRADARTKTYFQR